MCFIEASPGVIPHLVNNCPRTRRFSFAPSYQNRSNLKFETDSRPRAPVFTNGNNTTEASVITPCSLLGLVLDNFLDGYATPFSLDTEGSDPDVLETIGF